MLLRKILIRTTLTVVTIIVTLSLWIAIHIGLTKKNDSQHQRIDYLKSCLEKINQQLEKIPAMYQAIDYQKIPEIDLHALTRQQQLILRFLQKLAESASSTLYLQQIKFEKNQWVIEGIADGVQPILNYNELLTASDQANNSFVISKPNSLDIQEKDSFFHFRITISPRTNDQFNTDEYIS